MNENDFEVIVAGEGNRRETTIDHPDLRLGVAVFVFALLDLLVIRKARLQKVVDMYDLPIELDKSGITRADVADALDYIVANDNEWATSFNNACCTLGLNCEATREELVEMVRCSKNPHVKAGLKIHQARSEG